MKSRRGVRGGHHIHVDGGVREQWRYPIVGGTHEELEVFSLCNQKNCKMKFPSCLDGCNIRSHFRTKTVEFSMNRNIKKQHYLIEYFFCNNIQTEHEFGI